MTLTMYECYSIRPFLNRVELILNPDSTSTIYRVFQKNIREFEHLIIHTAHTSYVSLKGIVRPKQLFR